MCSVVNKRMHPRNIFKTPPDYTDLAIKYAEFRKVCRLELNGKVSVDLKNEIALRTLTQTLCLEYFQLKVEFAPGSLVPTLSLRLNYILWLEDLFMGQNNSIIKGIDLGCGSSCIYSLLAARKNKWHMVALESDKTNFEFAQQNICNNELQDYITLFQQSSTDHIFQEFFNSDHFPDKTVVYDFCLCNPPFYDSNLGPSTSNTRNPKKRPPPRNCPTGKAEELSCEGGEVKFVEKIIEDSLLYPNKIRIFTTMLGHKSSSAKVLALLEQRDIQNYSTTEFHQGRTTRWSVAWSFSKDLNLKSIQSPPESIYDFKK